MTITVGPQANGDVKGLGKQEGGAQTSTNTTTQSSSPTQDVSPEAVARAAGDLLATVAPGSEAARFAQAAIDTARGGDVATARELLLKAKAAASGAQNANTDGAKSGTAAEPPSAR